jgi:hypothetical protein
MMRDPSGKIPPIIIGAFVIGGLILASPSAVNAPAPGDPVYYPDNPLILNAAGGTACSFLFNRFATPFLSRVLGGMGDDIIELGISQGSTRSGANIPEIIYRGGKPNPGNLTPRAIDNGNLSFRDSISNPYPLEPGQRPVFGLGDGYFGLSTKNLPPGSVIPDNIPPGHVTVRGVSPEILKAAEVIRDKFPK